MGQKQQKFRWHETLTAAQNSDYVSLDERGELDERAADWEKCAVGECLRDIGVKSKFTEIAEKMATLEDQGQEFSGHVNKCEWWQAAQVLKKIREYVNDNSNSLQDLEEDYKQDPNHSYWYTD